MPLAFEDRKSTRLNSSHRCISYAVFCLKTLSPPIPTLFPYTTLFRSDRDPIKMVLRTGIRPFADAKVVLAAGGYAKMKQRITAIKAVIGCQHGAMII